MRKELVTAGGTVVSLRPASADDDDFLHELYGDRRAPELAALGWNCDDRQAFIDMQFRAQQEGYASTFPDATHWLVLVDGQRAGRLLVDHTHDGHRVVDLVILTPYRGRGVGTALMKETVNEALGDGVPVRLSVAAHDDRLVKWYRRLGFSVLDERLPNVAMAWFPPPRAEGVRPLSAGGFAAFRLVVLGDRRLQAELLAAPARCSFVAAVVEHARARGFDVQPDDVEEALLAARRGWHLRWI